MKFYKDENNMNAKMDHKRGMVLLVAVLMLISLVVIAAINAQLPGEGCCVNPGLGIGLICTETDVVACCAGDDYCIANHFLNMTGCAGAGDLCEETFGCCVDPMDEMFCRNVRYKAQCSNRTAFVKEQLCEARPECGEGCCICTDGVDYIWHITKGAECRLFCKDVYMNMFDFNETITDDAGCSDLAQHLVPPPPAVVFGVINGTVTDVDKNPLPNARVVVYGVSAITDADGFYSIGNIPLNRSYRMASFLEGYKTSYKDVYLVQSITVDWTLEKVKTAALYGTVVDSETSAGIVGAIVTLTPTIYGGRIVSSTTKKDGAIMMTAVPVEDTGLTLYDITIQAEGYRPYRHPIPIALSPGSSEYIDVELEPFGAGCGYRIARPPIRFRASHMLGKKAVKLSWTRPCTTVTGYYLEKNGVRMFISDLSENVVYIDEDVEWDSSYDYSLTAIYDFAGESSPVSTSIKTGQADCEGKIGEFCFGDVLRKECDETNRVIAARTGTYADCSDAGDGYFCTGPDERGLTYCKNRAACSSDALDSVFGLYTDLQSCLGVARSQISPNYCYYDYSGTIVDACFSCENVKSCFDYRSELACENDEYTCLVGGSTGCEWVDVVPGLGKGICVEKDYNKSDRCRMCSWDDVFFNLNCSQRICSKLGRCVAEPDGSSCVECSKTTRCEQFSTKESCGQAISVDGCDVVHPGSDGCGLGVCRWDDKLGCVKDGNADGIADCAADDIVCQSDTVPIETRTLEKNIVVTADNPYISFIGEAGAKLTYCINHNNDCCKDIDKVSVDYPATGKIDVKIDDYKDGKWMTYPDNTYYIRFYSTDKHGNQESVKSRRFYVDFAVPDVSIDYEIVPIDEDNADLLIDIVANEVVECVDSLDGMSELPEPTRIDYYKGLSYSNISYKVYRYKLSCSDLAGNSVLLEEDIAVKIPHIIITSPLRITKDTGFFIVAETKQRADCELYDGNVFKQKLSADVNKRRHTSSPIEYNVPATTSEYSNYIVRCDIEGIGVKEQVVRFTVDYSAPSTLALLETSKEQYREAAGGWSNDFEEDVSVALDCRDLPSRGFGCDRTEYCLVDRGRCGPNLVYNGSIDLSKTKTICYRSSDRGGNVEETKCGIVAIDKPIEAYLISPKWGVSNKNAFNVKIGVDKDAAGCKYANDPNFDYATEGFEFERLGARRFIERDFPVVLWGVPFEKTDGIVLDNQKIMPYVYKMCVVCEDTAGIISKYVPCFELRYDPTAPAIKKAFASSVALGFSTDEIDEDRAYINVVTDDETICKFSRARTKYKEMESGFEGYDYGDFRREHYALLTGLADKETHSFKVQCKNKAEDLSKTVTISFFVDKFGLGAIKSATAAVNDSLVTFKVQTSKPVGARGCRYADVNFSITDFGAGGGTPLTIVDTEKKVLEDTIATHLAEGRYQYKVICEFITGTFDDEVIDVVVDRSEPRMIDVVIGPYVCDTREIRPVFFAEDNLNLSEIVRYNWTLTGANASYGGSTGDESPEIDDLDLAVGERYILSVMCEDAAGFWSEEVSASFEVAEADSIHCTEEGPPTVTIKETENIDGTKDVEILCDDENGCGDIYYGIASLESECDASDIYLGKIYVTQTSYICYLAYDVAGNNASGIKRIEITAVDDSDGDGIGDALDRCPFTPPSERYDIFTEDMFDERYGCGPSELPGAPPDEDHDGIADDFDQCPGTMPGEIVDGVGCSAKQRDSDVDGVEDAYDICPNTPFDEITKVITDPNSEWYGCGPSERPKRIIPLLLLLLGIVLVFGGAGYLIYARHAKKQPVIRPVYRPPTIRPVYRPPVKPVVPSVEERRKRARELLEKRLREKREKRMKLFEVFAPKKKSVEKELKRPEFKKVVEKTRIPKKKKEFETLAKMTAEHITKKKEAIKLSGREFKDLTELIKKKAPSKKLVELKKEVKDVFRKLGELIKKKKR